MVRPTIKELEDILDDESGGNIEIQPDGSIKVVEGEPNHSKFKIHTFNKILGDTY